MDAIAIRGATLDDIEILLEYEQGIIQAERPFDPTLKADPISYYDLQKLIESDQAEVVVSTIAGKIVGSGYVKIMDAKAYQQHDQYAYLGFMFVSQEHRGKGVNQKVVDALIAWSKKQGLTEVRLEVYEDNVPALRAYEKAGFKKHMVEMRMRT